MGYIGIRIKLDELEIQSQMKSIEMHKINHYFHSLSMQKWIKMMKRMEENFAKKVTWVTMKMTWSRAMKQQLTATAITPKSLVYCKFVSFRQKSHFEKYL